MKYEGWRRSSAKITYEIERLKKQKASQGSHQGEVTQQAIVALSWVIMDKAVAPGGADVAVENPAPKAKSVKASKKSTPKAQPTFRPVPKGGSKKPDKKAAAKAALVLDGKADANERDAKKSQPEA